MQVEELGSGLDTLVNGHAITGRVEVEYPASVQVGEVTLVMEDNGVEGQVREAAAEPVPPVSTMLGEVTIPQRSPDCSQIGSLSSR